jgi:hypothetical protein
MPKSSLESAKERIELAVTGSQLARHRTLREQTYDRILAALSSQAIRRSNTVDGSPANVLLSVLEAVLRAHEGARRLVREGPLGDLRSRYWRERDRLEKEIEAISLSPLVMPFTHLIKFRSIEAVYCEHGKYRQLCVWIRQQLEHLHAVPSDARTRRFLTALRVDPNKARLDDFCPPLSVPEIVTELVSESQNPPRPRRRSRGRPLDDPVVDEFIMAAGTILEREGGLSQQNSYGLAADLAGVCLGPEVNAESKLRQARRRRQQTARPNKRQTAQPARRTK